MNPQFLYASVLILFCTLQGFAQTKPVWLTNFENIISQKERTWKIHNKLERFEMNGFDYNLSLKSNRNLVGIQIIRINNLPNPEETFAGEGIGFSNQMGKKAIKTVLKNFGDQAVLWKGNSFVKLDFRKGDVFVHIFTSSEITAKRFAQYILKQIPPS